MSEDMAVAVGGLGFLMCASLFKMKWQHWVKLWESLTNFDTFGKPEDFDKIKYRCNLFSMMYSLYISGGMCVSQEHFGQVFNNTRILCDKINDLIAKSNINFLLEQIYQLQ